MLICPKYNQQFAPTVKLCPDCKLELIPEPDIFSADELYKIAYSLHYDKCQFEAALNLYQKLIELYPDKQEAECAKTQIKNIESAPAAQRLRPINIAAKTETPDVSSCYSRNNITEEPIKTPGLTTFFNILGLLSIVGGAICAASFWPSPYALTEGYVYKTTAYIPSIAWLVSGIISAVIFFAFGKIIEDLNFLCQNAKNSRNK